MSSTDPALRAARTADDDPVWAILKPIFRAGETYAVDAAISRAKALAYWKSGQTFVAEVDGQILGTYYLKPNQPGGGAHVCNCGFATSPEAQGKGIARAMLAHALATAKELGFEAMQFNFVLASNTRAIDLWRRAGFDTLGRIPAAFRHPRLGYVDALVMHRFLR